MYSDAPTLSVRNVPRQVREGLNAFAREQRIEVRHLEALLYDILRDPRLTEFVSRSLRVSLARWDPDLLRSLGKFMSDREHEFGWHGVWVRIPANGHNGEEHGRETPVETPE